MMFEDIFDWPSSRSTKEIGTSAISAPARRER